METIRKKLFLLLLFCAIGIGAKAQFYSLGTNVIGDATANLNAEFSFTVNRKWSAHFPVQYNPFVFDSDGKKKQLRNFTFIPGMRYWYRESYTGWFTGFQAVYSHFSVGGLWDDYRYAGDAYGAGISFGRAYALSKKWNWEWEVGLGGVYADYSKYICTHCGRKLEDKSKFYLAPTKLALRFVYLF